MKMVSQYYFIRKVLVRSLEGWRQNVKADAMARVKEVNKSQTVLSDCFNAFKKNYYGGQMLKNVVKSKQIRICQEIVTKWSHFAFVSRRNRDFISFFHARRNAWIKTQVLRAIRVASSRDIFLHKTFKLRTWFEAWASITDARRHLKSKGH